VCVRFQPRWAAHNVRNHDTGTKRFHHPLVGELQLTYETLQLMAHTGLMRFVYTAEPGSKSNEALNLLASWAATPDEAAATAAMGNAAEPAVQPTESRRGDGVRLAPKRLNRAQARAARSTQGNTEGTPSRARKCPSVTAVTGRPRETGD
jgi:hypothetical protein